MPPEMLAQKSQKWVSMQKKRYGEKRKGGYVDMGKQVRAVSSVAALIANASARTSLPSTSGKLSRTTEI